MANSHPRGERVGYYAFDSAIKHWWIRLTEHSATIANSNIRAQRSPRKPSRYITAGSVRSIAEMSESPMFQLGRFMPADETDDVFEGTNSCRLLLEATLNLG